MTTLVSCKMAGSDSFKGSLSLSLVHLVKGKLEMEYAYAYAYAYAYPYTIHTQTQPTLPHTLDSTSASSIL